MIWGLRDKLSGEVFWAPLDRSHSPFTPDLIPFAEKL